MKRLLFVILLIFPGTTLLLAQTEKLAPTVIIISLDGFRYDYIDRGLSPNLMQLATTGVRARSMEPVFPSKTFANHYSQATGLYPSESGIVSNTMHDKSTDAWFRISDSAAVTSSIWWKGEPIWSTAVNQGQHSGCYFWPGSEAEIAGARPTFYEKFDGRVPHASRVAQVLAWLDLPADQRPTMITLYFSDTDGAGHRYGPDAKETNDAIATVDTTLGVLIDGLRKRDIFEQVNIIVVSDHGMAELAPDRVLLWDDVQDPKAVTVIEEGPVLTLDVPDDSISVVTERLRSLGPKIRLLTDDDLADEFHVHRTPRVPTIFAVAEEGWMILRRSRMNRPVSGGTHGYDNRVQSMQATFVAHGPAFKAGVAVDGVRAIDLYALMTHILGLKPAPNSGSLGRIQMVLR